MAWGFPPLPLGAPSAPAAPIVYAESPTRKQRSAAFLALSYVSGAAPTFNPAWASNANVILGAGLS